MIGFPSTNSTNSDNFHDLTSFNLALIWHFKEELTYICAHHRATNKSLTQVLLSLIWPAHLGSAFFYWSFVVSFVRREPAKSGFNQYCSYLSPRLHRGSISPLNSEILFWEFEKHFFYFSSRSMSINDIICTFVLKYANYVAETALHVEIIKMMTLIFTSLKLLKSLTRRKIDRRVVLISKALNLLCNWFAFCLQIQSHLRTWMTTIEEEYY